MRLPYLLIRAVQPRYTVGVAAVVLDGEGRVLLVEHTYHPRYPWGLPGGWIDRDEDPARAVLRELDEELGLEARVVRILHLSKTLPNHIDLAYLCEARGSIGSLCHELLDYSWVARGDLPPVKRFHRRSIDIAFEDSPGSVPWTTA